MCKCNDFEGHNYSKLDTFYQQDNLVEVCVFKDAGQWFIETSIGDKVISTIKIEYCPLCGREL